MEASNDIELLTVEAYAKRFHISRTTVFEWKKQGILIPGRHYIKIGRTLRFVWRSDLIGELHGGKFQDAENNEKQETLALICKKALHKKSVINMEY